MSRRNVTTDALNRRASDMIHDEAMVARELQAGGMSRGDALRAAARQVAGRYANGRAPGRIISTGRVPGDNGGPVLSDGPSRQEN